MRDALPGDLQDAEVQEVEEPELGENVFQISTDTLEPDEVTGVRTALDEEFGVNQADFSANSIGPTFGEQIARTALIAVIASLILISIYIGAQVRVRSTRCPVLIALFHDILITAGVYALADREVTSSTVAALLTILGYSLYDTIIVFDRIRENVPRMPRAAFTQIVNRSMAEVLTRSLATSFCTLLPVSALMFFGGETLRDFAFALLVGIASGAYSSIFIASPVLSEWKEREPVYRRRRKMVMEEHGGVVPAFATGAIADQEPGAAEPAPPTRAQAPGAPAAPVARRRRARPRRRRRRRRRPSRPRSPSRSRRRRPRRRGPSPRPSPSPRAEPEAAEPPKADGDRRRRRGQSRSGSANARSTGGASR